MIEKNRGIPKNICNVTKQIIDFKILKIWCLVTFKSFYILREVYQEKNWLVKIQVQGLGVELPREGLAGITLQKRGASQGAKKKGFGWFNIYLFNIRAYYKK